jgi:hypothetical protein
MNETQLPERLFDPAADAPQAQGTGRACSAVPTAHAEIAPSTAVGFVLVAAGIAGAVTSRTAAS